MGLMIRLLFGYFLYYATRETEMKSRNLADDRLPVFGIEAIGHKAIVMAIVLPIWWWLFVVAVQCGQCDQYGRW